MIYLIINTTDKEKVLSYEKLSQDSFEVVRKNLTGDKFIVSYEKIPEFAEAEDFIPVSTLTYEECLSAIYKEASGWQDITTVAISEEEEEEEGEPIEIAFLEYNKEASAVDFEEVLPEGATINEIQVDFILDEPQTLTLTTDDYTLNDGYTGITVTNEEYKDTLNSEMTEEIVFTGTYIL